ncbi:MAG TPA: hypothetical protein VFP50_16155 [Anaeromyxobacteraceae bacterium]|nr:hypothetical protein [Anaeromyxobacteraceae bacterium]
MTIAAFGCKDRVPLRAAVTGSRLVNSWQDDGTVRKYPPPDLATTAVAALVPEGGGWREVPGTVNADGTFTIDDVGTGRYLLRLTGPYPIPLYFELTTRSVDLGTDAVGRPGGIVGASSTPATFSLTGLSPWGPSGRLELVSTGARVDAVIPAAPAAGATAGDFVLDFKGLLLPAAGDLGWVLQHETTNVGGEFVTAVVRSAPIAFTSSLGDGQAVTWPMALGTPPQGTLGVAVRRADFSTLLPEVAPGGATLSTITVTVRAVPRTWGAVSSVSAELLRVNLPPADVSLGTLSYGRPFPSWFMELRDVGWNVQWQAPAAFGASAVSGSAFGQRVEPAAGAPANVAPALGPARLPRIGGLDAAQPQAGVGLTPTLTWSPPLLGAPNRYEVSLSELPVAPAGWPAQRAWFSVAGTSLALPPGVLVAGKVYLATVYAVREPNRDPAAPLRITVPFELAPLITAPFTP